MEDYIGGREGKLSSAEVLIFFFFYVFLSVALPGSICSIPCAFMDDFLSKVALRFICIALDILLHL